MSGDPALQNHLLALLSTKEYLRIKDKLEPVSLVLGQVIYEAGSELSHMYFPMLYVMENGGTAEIGIAGNNGMVGYALFMGGGTTSSRAVVQIAGEAFRMEAADIRDAFALGGDFQNVMLRYTQSLITQISQTAVCNRLHSVEEQLCRWLLINHDQLPADKLVMTHELIANMLGVRREGVSIAAAHLQSLGIIEYYRGTITILDREMLEKVACECYKVVMDEYERLLGAYVPVNR